MNINTNLIDLLPLEKRILNSLSGVYNLFILQILLQRPLYPRLYVLYRSVKYHERQREIREAASGNGANLEGPK